MTVLWDYHGEPDEMRRHADTSFASTAVFDGIGNGGQVFAGGSKRLLTWQRTFGNNSDVIPWSPSVRSSGGGWVFASLPRSRNLEDVEWIELKLDSVFFDAGLLAGPDERGTFEGVTKAIADECALIGEGLRILRNGGTAVELFA